MIEFRTYIGVTLFFLGVFSLILIPILKLPIFIVYICLALMLAGSIIRAGNPFIMIGIGMIISALFVFFVWITVIIVLVIILIFRPYFPPETSAEEVTWSVFIITAVIEGIISMFSYILWCLRWDSYDTQEKKLKIKTKRRKAKKRKKTKKSNILPSFLDNQIQPTIKSKDIKKKSEQIKKEYSNVEIDIKAKSIKNERIRRANDDDYQFNSKFVDQLLKNAGITKETPKAETFMKEWDKAEAKRQLTKIYFCPYCMTKVGEKDKQLDREYFCPWCNMKTQKKNLVSEEK